ncbi:MULTISPECIES: cation acetate symporter [Bacillaceae]|uniref:solute symporter family protein n=1 Tax=Bacillaceae TaxID=186817 RepID=UPI0006217C39|nr:MULTISPECIES: sodium/solute symporter [Bacillaceae]KKE78788.1 symporter [Bacilli bacterium VT-13-104]PZD84624.1 cation/acetate symporter ActP [Bacilli bacterium]MED4474459.1 sodium/solute symporter [Oceanobacillus caeni]PZD89196.1 cation/acetate symporter ActP [Bacilli bacterium]PZD91769.1 cation/acetate symporter ActP [Bacilli bacterium]
MDPIVVILFIAIVILTLVITYFAAKNTKSTGDFYTAGGGLTGWQNGLAIAGDYLSAASFLGIAGAIALNGFDGFFYSIGFLIAYLVVLFLVAEPLRNLGKYTLADMIHSRFDSKKVRGVAALSTITIVLFYMIAQLVGAGALIQLLFQIDYWIAVLIVGVMMTIYVLFGGMIATSWVQITKAVLLMAGMVIMAFLVLWKFDFNIAAMFTEVKTATSHGAAYLEPGLKYDDPLGTISLMIALVLGTAGLPHILMRFFTVKDAKTARSSVITATWTIGIFYILTLFLGFGAAIYVGQNEILAANSGGNMAAPLLAEALGGNILFAFISAVAFATILAVVAGLVLSGASAFAHDIYGQIIKKGKATDREQMLAARYASLAVSVLSIILALGAQSLNVAFLVSLAFCIAASANLPVILYTIYWKRFNTTGAISAVLFGLISALVLVSMSPSVFSPEAGAALFVGNPIFPLENPALVSVPLGFLGGYLGTIYSKEQDLKRYAEVKVKAHIGNRE